VRIFDLSAEQREAAHDYVEEHIVETQQTLGLHPARRGQVEVCDDLQEAVAGGWMVIEAVPERIDLKTAVFGDLDRFAEPDAILCSNSHHHATVLRGSQVGGVLDRQRGRDQRRAGTRRR
jgi:3-hydroxybutyryl-CoA dehydrogenase